MPATIARASITTPNTAHRNLRGWGVTVSAATASTPASPSPAACCSTNSDRSTAAPATTAPSPQAASLSHQEKNEATCRMDSPVQFTINAQSYTCADRSTLLIDFLHASPDSAVAPGAGLHGTKLACGQGGCGACTVNVRDTQAGEWIAVNSCLKPVGLLDGRDVLTIEGLGPAPTPTKRGDKAPAAAEGQKRSKCGCGDDGAHQTDVKTSDAASTASAACPAGGDCRSCSQKLLNPSPSRASSSPSDPRLVLAQYGGSQCGFCSPGMVMTARTALAGGGGKQAKTEMDMEDMFSGNLCRCTGYRSILCGMKTLTPSGNAEELLETPPYIFDETSDYANDPSRFAHKNVTVGNVPIEPPPPQPLLKNVQSRRAEKHLKSSAAVHPVTSLPSAQLPQPQSPKPPQQAQSQHSWFSPAPASLSDVIQALTNGWYGDNYKLVCGNSSYGVFPQWEWSGVSVLVDISRVPELSGINILPSAAGTATLPPGGTGSQAKAHSPPTIFPSGFLPPPLPLAPMFLCLGATSTIQALIDVLVQADEPSGNPYLKQASGMVQAMVKHLKRIAGYQVRNVGSIAGSLMMARLWNFPGDIYGIFAGVGATLQIWQRSTGTTTTMSLDEFQTLTGEFLLLSIQLPLWLDYEGENLWFGCARVAQRLQNSHPLVNGFFFCTFDNTEPSQAVSAYFGNITLANTPVNGPDQPLRPAMAASTSHYRLSRESALMVWQACYQAGWTGEYSLDNVMQTVLSELVSVASYPDTSAQGPIATRCDIAVNLLRKYCITHLGAPAPSGDPFGASIHQSLYDVRTAQPSRGSQSFMVNSSEEPVSEPMIKSSAIGQTSGLANYTHTLVPPDCLFGTFVTSWATAGKLTWLMNPTQAAEAVSAWYNQTYGGAFQPSQWQVWTGQDPSLAKINLMNAYFWTYAATPPSPSSYQNFPTYLLANVEVVYNGQPVAIITGPTERAVTLGAEWLGTQASQFFQVDVVTPILSISDAKSHQATQFSPYGTVMVDQNPNFIAATVFNTTNAVTSAPGHNPYHAINSVSKDPNGPNANTQIDFTQFDAETYDVFTGTHAVPAQMHMYMETQAAVAYPPTKTRPACAKQKKSKPHQPPSPTANSKDSDEDPLTAQQRARAASSKLIPPAAPVETQFMLMYASTQSCMSLQSQVTSMLNTIDPPGADQTWGVSLFTPQLGGGFGGKEVQSNSTSLAAAFAAWSTQKPVRFVLSRDADMKIIGHRHPFEGSFQVAVERATGRITAVQIDYAMDAGCTYDATLPIMDLALLASDNAYQFDYFCATGLAYFTNKASNTSFRSFGVVQAHQITEYILERVCERFPQFSPMQLRAVNFYPYQIASPFPRTPFGQEVKYANLDGVWTDIDSMMAGMSENKRFDAIRSRFYSARPHGSLSEADARALARAAPTILPTRETSPSSRRRDGPSGYDHIVSLIQFYNSQTSHRKLGLSVLPLKYGVSFTTVKMNMGECVIQVGDDGIVTTMCPGVEMGQGLDTKMRQLAALKLGIWSKYIRYDPTGVNTSLFSPTGPASQDPNKDRSSWFLPSTGASTGSDLNGGAVIQAAAQFLTWLSGVLATTANGQQVLRAYAAQNYRFFIPAQYNADGSQRSAQVDLWPQVVAALAATPSEFDASQPFILPYSSPPAYYYSPDLTGVSNTPGEAHVGAPFYYFNYGCAAVLAEIDALTGEQIILQADVIYDSGISLNPAIDIGQIEGGFVQGLGYNTTEEVAYDTTGKLTSINTWNYKIPTTLEIPQQFNIQLYPLLSQVEAWRTEEKRLRGQQQQQQLEDGEIESESDSTPSHVTLSPPPRISAHPRHSHPSNLVRKSWMRFDPKGQVIDPYGVQSSKSTGEPPLVLANACYFAIRNAVKAALGVPQYLPNAEGRSSQPAAENEVQLVCPATTFNIRNAILQFPSTKGRT